MNLLPDPLFKQSLTQVVDGVSELSVQDVGTLLIILSSEEAASCVDIPKSMLMIDKALCSRKDIDAQAFGNLCYCMSDS